MPDHDLEREEHPGQRRVERGRHRRRDPAGQQGPAHPRVKPQRPRTPGTNGGAPVHHGSLAPDGRAKTQRNPIEGRRLDPVAETHGSPPQRRRRDHISHPRGAGQVGVKDQHQPADDQATDNRRGHPAPPVVLVEAGYQQLLPGPQRQPLGPGDQLKENNSRQPHQRPHDHRQPHGHHKSPLAKGQMG